MNTRIGKTTRMLEYAIGAARQGREIAIIANSQDHRVQLLHQLRDMATKAGCAWVVGGDYGGPGKNIEIYQVSHTLVQELHPGEYELRGSRKREILVDNCVYEDRYRHVLENYARWC